MSPRQALGLAPGLSAPPAAPALAPGDQPLLTGGRWAVQGHSVSTPGKSKSRTFRVATARS